MPATALDADPVRWTEGYQTCTHGEADRLIDAALSLRDRALVLVMLGFGIRVSEVQCLDCSDLVEVDREPVLWIRRGKGGKDRRVAITEEVSEAIHRYLAEDGRQVGALGRCSWRKTGAPKPGMTGA